MDREVAYVVLNMLKGVGPVAIRRLLERFDSAPAILEAKMPDLTVTVGEKLAATIYQWREKIDLDTELGKVEAMGIELISWESENYPPHLQHVSDPPCLLYARGKLEERDRHSIAVVGTRRMSHYGRESTKQLAYQLARAGYTIVSGLARGIDTIAHEGALAAGGRTIAVLGSGLAQLTPPENAKLAERILENGAVLSQFPIDYNADRQSFPIRNRVVSGMSQGVLIVEGSRQSGSMITAGLALEQGRHVFALPGQIDRPGSAGPNSLIQDGAKLVTRVEDILDELGTLSLDATGPPLEPTTTKVVLEGNDAMVYDALTDHPMSIEELSEKTNLPSATLSSTLLRLEMKRLARQLPGTRFEKIF